MVDDVDILSRATGFEVRIKFNLPLRYISHRPKTKGKILRIQLRPGSGIGLDNLETLQQLTERQLLSWNRSLGIPLIEMTYEGGNSDRPEMTLRFSKTMKFEVRSSNDLRTLIILVRWEKGKIPKEAIKGEPGVLIDKLPQTDLSKGDPKMAGLMDEAGGAIKDSNYRRAIQLYTKILQKPDTGFHQDAQELLGLSRERNKQLAHARAEYEEYLRKYPEGPASERVFQRLQGLLTAREKPREKLRKVETPDKEEWDVDMFGSLSEFYFYDVTDRQNGGRVVNQSELDSDLDFNTRFRKGDYKIRTRFFGSNEQDFLNNGSGNSTRVSTLSAEAENTKWGLLGRVGRWSRSSGGILGRFDGALLRYEITPELLISGVVGFPVEFSSADFVDTSKVFYGMNIDLGPFIDKWNFNLFVIQQEVDSITDRKAVGGEIRYFENDLSFFSFVDYDISYDELNIFLFNASYLLSTKTRLNLVFDHRKSPILTTSNALQGQIAVTEISQLRTLFTENAIRQLAQDRTSTSDSVTVGVTQDIGEHYQWIGEITVSQLTGTVASGGVLATPGTGNEYFFLTQLIRNDLFWDGDNYIFELRYSNTFSREAYKMSTNFRLPITPNFRVNPKVQVDYQVNKSDGGVRTTIRPILGVDYRWNKWLRFEVEAGQEFREDPVFGTTESSVGFFVNGGVRAFF